MAQVLRHLPAVDDPRVMVAALSRDDAAVFRLSEDRALVATVDFFTPVVDDPYTFGAIAATNAFSDLYAMGATPLFALNLVGWPRNPEMLELLGEVIRGASDVANRARAMILGGHSIDDPEPKFGMVAIGDVHPEALVTNAGARPGDLLILTKPIGTGVLSTALKKDKIDEDDMREAIDAMTTLNARAAAAMHEWREGVHAATDITGFGLLGHLHAVLESSRVSAKIKASSVPRFRDVERLIAEGAVPGGTERNLDAANQYTSWHADVDHQTRVLLADAQTSGGLLIAVDPSNADGLCASLDRHDVPVVATIGEIVADGTGTIVVVP